MALGLNKVEAADLSQRTQWYVFVRLLLLLVIALPGILSLYIFEGWSDTVERDVQLVLIGVGTNALFYVLARVHKGAVYQKYLAGIWISLDVILISAFIFTNGGIESRSPILYTVPILISAAIFGRLATYITAISCAIIYAGLVAADYFNIIHSIGAFDNTLRTQLPYVINSIFFFPSILIVIALAVDFITKLLIEKQQQAHENLIALNRAQDIAKLGSWEWDIQKDSITWSEGLLKIYGFKDQLHNFDYGTYLKMIHPDDANLHRRTIANALRTKKPFKVDHRVVMPDGTIKYLHGEGRPLLDRHGEIIKLNGTSQDVTEMYHLDVAKREFVSLASHQLRTPASGVKAFLSLLIDGYVGEMSKKQREFLKKAYESNDRQLEIIDNLLNLAAIESGKLSVNKEPANLNEIAKRCLPNHKHEALDKRQRLITHWAKSPPIINADISLLPMAIDNLLSNAIKYTPHKGRITLTTTVSKASAYLEVSDTGIGIAKNDLPALFQKFSRLSDPASKTVGGSGLGLYLTKHIIKLHGGTITVRSRHGEGTQFIIKLPLSTQESKLKRKKVTK